MIGTPPQKWAIESLKELERPREQWVDSVLDGSYPLKDTEGYLRDRIRPTFKAIFSSKSRVLHLMPVDLDRPITCKSFIRLVGAAFQAWASRTKRSNFPVPGLREISAP